MADALGTPAPAATPTVGVVSDEDHRLDLAGLIAPQSSSLAVRTGIMLSPTSTAVITGTSATGTMTVNVLPHHWVTTRGTGDGIYLGTKETSTTLTIAAAPGSNSRIDVVYSKQNDSSSSLTPDATTGELYGVVTGTAAASPTKPTVPFGAIEIGTVTVAAGATNTLGAGVTIATTAPQVVARGADIPVRNQTERDALTLFTGLTVKRLDLGGLVQRYTGSTWLTSDLAPISYQYPVFQNNWKVFDSTNYERPRYYLNSSGELRIVGVYGQNVSIAAGTTTVIFNVPTGYRPPRPAIRGGSQNNTTMQRVDVSSNGDVTHIQSNGTFGIGNYLALDITVPLGE